MKRAFDIAGALLAIIILSPVIIIVAICVFISDGSPVLYKQKRVGKASKEFTIYKFRSMKKDTRLAATHDLKEADDQIISCGRLLRKTSLDELPQLINILKGDMSFVGPRPLITDEEEIHSLRREFGVYSVRPGLTGLAQVSGRDKLTNLEKATLDKQYVDGMSIAMDMKILFRTVKKVFKMSDIVEGNNT